MNLKNEPAQFEYPDAAGYPDGSGFLDQGTAAARHGATSGAIVDVDRPSVDADSEMLVHRDDTRHVWTVTINGRDIASIRYNIADGRVVILATNVEPEFRGRGIADELIAYALDDVRALGMRVTVYCTTVARFLSENQQFSDLIDPAHPGQ